MAVDKSILSKSEIISLDDAIVDTRLYRGKIYYEEEKYVSCRDTRRASENIFHPNDDFN